MKKSKFLKKSLAMLLAVMLVVAMIPLSASADETGYIKDLYVNGQRAALVDGQLSVTVPDTDKVDITAAALNGATLYVQVDGQDLELPELGVALENLESTSENVYQANILAKKKLTPESSDEETVQTYPLTITVEQPDPDNDDTTLRGLTAGAAEWANMTNYVVNHEDETVTITLKFGYDRPALSGEEFQPTNLDAKVTMATDNEGNEAVKVTSVQGSSKLYTVVFQWEPAFESFTIPGQVGDTEFVYNGKDNNEINIDVPYGYDLTSVIPTFELVEGMDDFYVNSNNSELVSDYTVLDCSSSVLLRTYVAPNTAAYVTLNVTRVAKNPEGVLKTITVTKADDPNVKSNETTVTEGTTYVELPKGTTIKGNKFNLTLTASKNATVKVTDAKNQNVPVTKGADGVTFVANNASASDMDKGISFTIQVTSEDGSVTNNYNIVLQTPDVALATLNNVVLKDTVTGEYYDAEINQATGEAVVTVPYAWTNAENRENVVVYWKASTGAIIQRGDGTRLPDEYNGSEVNDFNALCRTGWVPEVNSGNSVTFTIYNNDASAHNDYTLKIVSETAKKDREITDIQFVGTDKPYEITESNTYLTEIGTAKLSDGTEVRTLEVTIPYSLKDKTVNAWLSNLKLSDGAVAYYVNNAETESGVISPMGSTSETNSPTTFDNIAQYVGKVNAEGVITRPYMRVVVLSEENAVPEGAFIDDMNKYTDKENASIYYLVTKVAPAETGSVLESMESTLDTNVTATLEGDTVTITVPATYVGDYTNGTKFTLNFTASKLAEVTGVTDDYSSVLESDLGSELVDGTKFVVNNGKLFDADAKNSQAINQIVVTAENDRNTHAYDVKVVVNKPETGAVINGLSVNGTAATIARDQINVRLPLGSKLYPVTLDIDASKMATVLVNGKEYVADERYDVNKPVTIKVTSEDKKTTNTYTLTATVAEGFNDVTTNDWFYDEVMTAANAGWINGMRPGEFEPRGTMTRAQFVKIVAEILGCDTDATVESLFPDCNETDWFNAAVTFCVKRGIIDGDNYGYFNPNAPITREQMAKIICTAKGLEEVDSTDEPFADDAQIADWAKGYVNACQEAGIFLGDNHGNFNPRANATRAEGAAVLVRTFA